MDLNRATILGRLGRAPEIRSVQSGDRVANLSVAASQTWKDKDTGEKRERTEWFRIVIWGSLVDVAEKYLEKGSRVYIEGQIETRKWQDQSGADRYSTEIVLRGYDAKLIMLDGTSRQQDSGHPSDPARQDPLDDDIGF